MAKPSLQELLNVAMDAAYLGGRRTLAYFKTGVAVETKSDDTPVTRADKEAEQVIRERIKQSYPSHAVIGEEHGEEKGDANYRWIIDPIDGTKSYLAGAPTFGMLLALLYEGAPVLGIIDIPALDERWCGVTGQATSMNGRPVKTSSCTAVEHAVLTIISPDKLEGDEGPAVEALSRMARVRRYSSAGYSHALLASGYVDMVVAVGQQPFDYLAVVPVVEGAGGRITDWGGEPLRLDSDGRILVTATPELHREALNVLQDTKRLT